MALSEDSLPLSKVTNIEVASKLVAWLLKNGHPDAVLEDVYIELNPNQKRYRDDLVAQQTPVEVPISWDELGISPLLPNRYSK